MMARHKLPGTTLHSEAPKQPRAFKPHNQLTLAVLDAANSFPTATFASVANPSHAA